MAKLTKQELKFYRQFHTPSCGNLTGIKVNAIFIVKKEDKGYTKEHEEGKFELAWEARTNNHNYIIEAARKATDKEREMFKIKKDKVIDFVNLTTEDECEIIHKHESDKQIKFYRDNGTIPIIVGETIICRVCGFKYPKRKKDNICQICN